MALVASASFDANAVIATEKLADLSLVGDADWAAAADRGINASMSLVASATWASDVTTPSLADISFIGTPQTDEAITTTSLSVSLPSGSTTDDLVLLHVCAQDPTTDATSTNFIAACAVQSSGDTSATSKLLYGLRQTVGAGPYTVSLGLNTNASVVCFVVRGADTSTPFDALTHASHHLGEVATADLTATIPAITTSTDKAMILQFSTISHDSSAYTVNTSSGTNLYRLMSANTRTQCCFYELQATAGAYSEQTHTYTGNSTGSPKKVSLVCAIKPAST